MIDGVPEAMDLVRMGLAETRPNGVWISPKGHELLGEKLREASKRNGHPTGEKLRLLLREQKARQAKDK